jgi:hypothetical protein
MDNLVTIYHGGTVEVDRYGYVELVDMHVVPMVFDERPSFAEMVARAREELHCHGGDDGIAVEGLLNLGSPSDIRRRIIPIVCEDQWEKHVKMAMKSQLQAVDVVVRRVVVDATPRGFSLGAGEEARFEPPARELDVEVEVMPTVPDANSCPNDVPIPVADPPQEIPLTQNHPSKCRLHIVDTS